MRAVQVITTTGPADLEVRDVEEPTPGPDDVLVEVHRVGISFPDLLLSKGEYQLKPEPPFTLGVDFAGTVLRPAESGAGGFVTGQRVAGVGAYGGAAEVVATPAMFTFALPDALSFDEGAALPMNYLTAQFALAERGSLRAGETVLVHGAAGGVGTATIQVAKGYGARTIAVVSSDEKAAMARRAGADETVLVDGFRDAVTALTDGRGVDVVMDVVGGDLFTDSLRVLAPQGRLLVVGFAAGQGIPQVKVNRLLLNNVDVRGVGWGAYAMTRPGYMQQQWAELLPMMESGVVRPPIGATYDARAVRPRPHRHGAAPHARQVGRPRRRVASGACVVSGWPGGVGPAAACLAACEAARRRPGPGLPATGRPAPTRADGLSVVAEADADGYRLHTASGDKTFLPGINLGSSVPTRQPGELDVLTAADYRRWFGEMADLGIRVIRIYTLHPPAFYDELAAWNRAHPRSPFYLVQGVYLPDESYVEPGTRSTRRRWTGPSPASWPTSARRCTGT